MALTAEQKDQLFELLAQGKGEIETAKLVGCSRSTVQRLKRDPKNQGLLKIAKSVAPRRSVTPSQVEAVETIRVIAELSDREPAIERSLWAMFEGITALFQSVIDQAAPEDISPRQLPALARSACEVAVAYANFSDRAYGLSEIAAKLQEQAQPKFADETIRAEQVRQK